MKLVKNQQFSCWTGYHNTECVHTADGFVVLNIQFVLAYHCVCNEQVLEIPLSHSPNRHPWINTPMFVESPAGATISVFSKHCLALAKLLKASIRDVYKAQGSVHQTFLFGVKKRLLLSIFLQERPSALTLLSYILWLYRSASLFKHNEYSLSTSSLSFIQREACRLYYFKCGLTKNFVLQIY